MTNILVKIEPLGKKWGDLPGFRITGKIIGGLPKPANPVGRLTL